MNTAPDSLHYFTSLIIYFPENAVEVVEMIELLLDDHSKLSYEELETVLNKLTDVVDLSVVTPNLCQSLINIISDIFVSDSNLSPFTNT